MKEYDVTHKWKVDAYDNTTYAYLCTLGTKNIYHNVYVYSHDSGMPFCFHRNEKYLVYTGNNNEHYIYVDADNVGIPSTMPIRPLSADIGIDYGVKQLCKHFELFICPTHKFDRFNVVNPYGDVVYENIGIRKLYKELRTKKGLEDFSIQMGRTFGL